MESAAKQIARHALVLGGGGPLGIAWQAGMLEGWAESWSQRPGSSVAPGAGPTTDSLSVLDPGPLATLASGRIIGTSAGAVVGSFLAAHGSCATLFAHQNQPIGAMPAAPKMTAFMAAFLKAKLLSRTLPGLRRSLGKSARTRALAGESEWVATIAGSYAPQGPWPRERELLITVIDAQTGELHTWDRQSGVPLALAVAASCAVPCAFPLVHVHGRPYMDGGIGSSTNAGLAAGCARVLVLDPLGRMLGSSSPLEAERRALEAAGSHTLALLPDEAVSKAIGLHMLDTTRRAEVAKLGRLQGLATSAGVFDFLHGT